MLKKGVRTLKKVLSFVTAMLVSTTLFLNNVHAEVHFSDVRKDHWAYDSIQFVSNLNIVNGYQDGTYHPNEFITRAQAAKVLAKALKLDLSTEYSPKFIDVSIKHSAYKQIAKLTELGIFQNNKLFHPNDYLSRGQLSKILAKGFKIEVDNVNKQKFSDVSLDYWAYHYIHTLAEIKISKGVDDVHFKPTGTVTRAHMAANIERAIKFKELEKKYQVVYDYLKQQYIFSEPQYSSFSHKTVSLVNIERKKAGLPLLTLDEELSQVALIKSKDLAEHGYWDHHSPLYGPPWEMAGNFDYTYRSFGENIARNYHSPEEVVKAWMNSEGHRANILKANYTQLGVGITEDQDGNLYWVHMFASK